METRAENADGTNRNAAAQAHKVSALLQKKQML